MKLGRIGSHRANACPQELWGELIGIDLDQTAHIARHVTSRISSMENDNVELLRLGRRIRTERKLLGLTQNRFAQDCGLNRSHFGGIERGERNLTFLVIRNAARFVSCIFLKTSKLCCDEWSLGDSNP
jgi:DNA-binding XRE family transcriptional regulator